ncbi:MAG: flippase [bacterium]|nr:flippase [bacterium]
MAYGARIARNALLLMGATAGQKVIAFVAFIFVARLLGTDLTGVYFYAVSITSIFVIFADLGMTPVVIRAIAGGRKDGGRLFSAALRLKLYLAPVAIFLALGYAFFTGADSVTFISVAIACLVMTADTFHLVMYGALRGKQNLKPEAVGMFIGQTLTGVCAIGAAWFGYGPIGLVLALLIGSTWNVTWSFLNIRGLKMSIPKARIADYRRLAIEALPFGIAGLSVKVYSYVDSLFLHRFYGAHAVGIYAVAYKLTYALQFLPITFTAALYPALASAYAKKEASEVQNIFLGSLRLMTAIGFPITAGLSALAPKIIPLLYGDAYLASVDAFRILPWVLLPIFLDFPIGALLNATHRAHLKTGAMVATMIINVVANAILVPKYGPVGAAWAGVLSFWILFGIGAWFTRKNTGNIWHLLSLTLRGLIAAGVSWMAWGWIGEPMPLLTTAIFGTAVAIVMGFAVGLVTVQDVFRFVRRVRPTPQNVETLHEEG